MIVYSYLWVGFYYFIRNCRCCCCFSCFYWKWLHRSTSLKKISGLMNESKVYTEQSIRVEFIFIQYPHMSVIQNSTYIHTFYRLCGDFWRLCNILAITSVKRFCVIFIHVEQPSTEYCLAAFTWERCSCGRAHRNHHLYAEISNVLIAYRQIV